MTALTNGSEKQIAWASSMREQHIRNTHAVIEHLETVTRHDGMFAVSKVDYAIHVLTTELAAFEAITDAKAIIDMKDELLQRHDGTWTANSSHHAAANAIHRMPSLPNDLASADTTNLRASLEKAQADLSVALDRKNDSLKPVMIAKAQKEITQIQRMIDAKEWAIQHLDLA